MYKSISISDCIKQVAVFKKFEYQKVSFIIYNSEKGLVNHIKLPSGLKYLN